MTYNNKEIFLDFPEIVVLNIYKFGVWIQNCLTIDKDID